MFLWSIFLPPFYYGLGSQLSEFGFLTPMSFQWSWVRRPFFQHLIRRNFLRYGKPVPCLGRTPLEHSFLILYIYETGMWGETRRLSRGMTGLGLFSVSRTLWELHQVSPVGGLRLLHQLFLSSHIDFIISIL